MRRQQAPLAILAVILLTAVASLVAPTAAISTRDDADDMRLMHDKYTVSDGQVVWTGSTIWSEDDIAENHN